MSARDAGLPFQARFTYTHGMVNALTRIEAARSVIEVLPLPPDQVLLLRHQARQRATRNSTAIEGNTRWLDFFCGTMADAAGDLRKRAESLHPAERRQAPWDELHRTQQQLLSKLLLRRMEGVARTLAFQPQDIRGWYGVSAATAREWLGRWRAEGFVCPERLYKARVRRYVLSDPWAGLLGEAIRKHGDKKGHIVVDRPETGR